ncbi:MAG: RdgB/HAM1 family non-canonical purine NTP pyrophosphatase [Verrucomicrobia bacterium]|nr:MAG: RdgB/HAM1 family non-canonical purine NTP pyrophosphatase [Verrucomicrobiota bacterium]
MPTQPRLIVATRNPHKSFEIRALLGADWEVLDVNDFAELPVIEEAGNTFLENARLKAEGISRLVAGWVLADDSGLEVDALGGAPGVWSSSFGGEEGNHALNNARLVTAIRGQAERSARFRCTMVLAKAGIAQADFCGTVEGTLTDSPQGEGGFGYDPLFIPEGYHLTFAQLGQDIKNRLSHRARALTQVIAWLAEQPQN